MYPHIVFSEYPHTALGRMIEDEHNNKFFPTYSFIQELDVLKWNQELTIAEYSFLEEAYLQPTCWDTSWLDWD